MNFKIHLLLLIAVLLFGLKTAKSQEIKTYNFNELEPIFHHQNDTTYVINFWAMWCKPCVEELPEFEDIRKDYSDQKVKVILISLDFGKNVKERLTKFLAQKKMNTHVILLDDPDADLWIGKVDAKWDGALPATLIYKEDQRKMYTQQVSYSELAKSIKKIINQTN